MARIGRPSIPGCLLRSAPSPNSATGRSPAAPAANTVTLNGTRNIQGILFSSGTAGHNYTINNAGSGSIILDNTANSAPATITDSSTNGNSNAINVPITLNSNLVVTVTNPRNTDTIGAAIGDGGTGKTLTMGGLGTLVLGASNTYIGLTTITSGTLKFGANNAILAGNAVTVSATGSSATLDLAGFTGNIGGAGLTLSGSTTSSVAR